MMGVVACSLAPLASRAVSDLDDELRYIDALQRMNLLDIAEEIIAEARKRFSAAEYPEAAPQLKVREIQAQLSQGKFDEVQKIVDAIADKNSAEYWALFLSMADYYYARSQHAEADKRYQEFFKKVEKPPAALVTFFRDSAYKYAQMLLAMNRDADALAAYRHLFKIPLDEGVQRQVQADVAELLIKLAPAEQKKETREAMLKEAEGQVDKLLWKQDIWFGKAIVMKAHIIFSRGKLEEAKALVENYMPQLKIIHDALKEDDPNGTLGMLRMSPMPQCRYLMAVLLLNAAQAEIKKGDGANEDDIKDLLLGVRDAQTKKRKGDGAINHFANVFIRFPESQWAADAGERVEFIRKLVKDRYDADIGMRVTESDMEKVRKMQYAGAQLLFAQNQFKEAAERYLSVLNQFPEAKESVSGLGDLAIAFIELSDADMDADMMADTVAAHLSERFAEQPDLMRDAGDQLRRIGEFYGERKMEDKRRETYALFFRDYPGHYAAGQLVMSFAEREYKGQNYLAARHYYAQITEVYTNSPYYYDALSRLAQIEREEGNPAAEITALENYVAKLAARDKPSSALIVGKFRLASAQREYASALLKGGASTNEAAGAAEEAVTEEEAAKALLEAKEQAAVWLDKAIAGLNDVVKCLTDSPDAYQVNDDEKKRNAQIKEMAVFTRAVCLTQMQHPPEKLAEFRKAAIGALEEYVKLYPKGEYAPKAQLQIGTLYTILQDAGNAQSALEKLRKDHADSNEAKNAVPMLAASLIEMGMRAEGVALYRQMFSLQGATYTEGQFMAAAKALEDAREYDLALQAYDKVMELLKDPQAGNIPVAKLGRARVLNAQKRYADARKLLTDFIKDYAKHILMVDANRLLVEAASEEAMTEKNGEERTKLFNMAVGALRVIKRYLQEPEQQREIDLMVGQMLARRMEAEKKFGTEAKVADIRGEAIVVFHNIMHANTDPENAKLAVLLEKAYFAALPLMLEHKVNDLVIEDCENYLRIFPLGRYRTDVQNWLNQARIGQ
ncbi:MAG: hypothetical protein FWG50_07615 [Kiritimatiellaeota bacterium]|nr:hypothetical protein [Kiritimatiellota bacterium]